MKKNYIWELYMLDRKYVMFYYKLKYIDYTRSVQKA